ncbi:uncharacterized protein TNCV_3651271 [Trichonephila clavipes]|nr:uncharacterized protein TNCV_3651271 [Trichonephila clavipes]
MNQNLNFTLHKLDRISLIVIHLFDTIGTAIHGTEGSYSRHALGYPTSRYCGRPPAPLNYSKRESCHDEQKNRAAYATIPRDPPQKRGQQKYLQFDGALQPENHSGAPATQIWTNPMLQMPGLFHIEILFKEYQVYEVRKAPPHQGSPNSLDLKLKYTFGVSSFSIFTSDQGDTPEILDEILTTARDLELEVNEDDIEELIMGHEDELTTEELQKILNEEHQETHRNVSPEQEEDEREPMPTSAIKDLLKKWADARAMVLEWHPNQADARSPERINRFHIEVYGKSMIG